MEEFNVSRKEAKFKTRCLCESPPHEVLVLNLDSICPVLLFSQDLKCQHSNMKLIRLMPRKMYL